MNGEFIEALQQIAKEKDIPLDTLIETVESALATAYKRNNPTNGEIKVRIDSTKSAASPFRVYCEKLVVDEIEDEFEQITLAEAKAINPEILVGEIHPNLVMAVVIVEPSLGDHGNCVVLERTTEIFRKKCWVAKRF